MQLEDTIDENGFTRLGYKSTYKNYVTVTKNNLLDNTYWMLVRKKELEKFLDIGKYQIMSENVLTKNTFTFYKEGDKLMFFVHNGDNKLISFDLIINDDFFMNLKIPSKVWHIRKVDVKEIRNSRAFIDGVKYFEIDFTNEDNLKIMNDVKFIKK